MQRSGDKLNLIILRHGDAGARITAPDIDNDRALTGKGKRDIRQVAKFLKAMKLDIGLVATSPLTRARETAGIIAKELDITREPEIWDELRPESETVPLFGRIEKVKEGSTVLLVGHEPYLSALMSVLISGKKTTRITLKKAGAAKISMDSVSPRPSGRLKWLLTPKQMKKL